MFKLFKKENKNIEEKETLDYINVDTSNLEEYQKRVIEEYNDLFSKREKLTIFIANSRYSKKISDFEFDLLRKQNKIIYEYLIVLKSRILYFINKRQ